MLHVRIFLLLVVVLLVLLVLLVLMLVLLLLMVVLVVVLLLLLVLLLLQLLLSCTPPQVCCQHGNKIWRTWASSSALTSKPPWQPFRTFTRHLHPHVSAIGCQAEPI